MTAYFDRDGTAGRHRWNAGGSPRGVDREGWVEVHESATDRDEDLAPWLDSGRLRWIEPGDPDLLVRTGRDACPYVGRSGTTAWQRLQRGEVWTGPG